MVAIINVKHVFKYPVDKVAEIHLTKYPTDKEPTVIKVETKEHKIDLNNGADYRRRWFFCQNVVPQIMRVINVLNEQEIIFEEETWLNLHNSNLRIESRNISFSKYARLSEESTFTPSVENPSWTIFEQHGRINVNHLGPLNRVLEMFAKKCFTIGATKALKVMEEILYERCHSEKGNTSQRSC
ncbi:PRELI domain-containing protein 2-like isoform X2 [Biomphalaria glabrata]|uniref:PRELI domain-containing protein 2-like isoform X2 n=1 Tax=Biomphalaria glabrata TaxID=6526 RepID=A0A9U8EJF2_BIOGL|nr:PRELI domain-containing protein 2-like isoform X2 [Biomphalaria glabrata]KAI8735325.1 PRELI domain-containing protein 2-like isoform X2 [Biomphalaria glabrata]KAI8784607.1 PRELI domain-containing protein 2 isoform X2 [Biomphalaria glabrata]